MPSRRYETVSNPLCGWSGNPAPSFALPENSSNKRNGSKFRSSCLPMDLRTLAPLPSLCHRLSITLTICLMRFPLIFLSDRGPMPCNVIANSTIMTTIPSLCLSISSTSIMYAYVNEAKRERHGLRYSMHHFELRRQTLSKKKKQKKMGNLSTQLR